MDFKDEIHCLGFNSQNGLYFYTENNWKNRFPKRIEEVIQQKLKPYAIYDFNGEPFILFFDTPQSKEIHKWCWNLNCTALVIIREENQLKIYNGLAINQKDKFLELLQENEKKLDDFSYINLVSGTFLERYGKRYNEKTRVDQKLLENIGTAREILINQYGLKPSIVNGLIGRLIFVRYLIDRKVKLGEYGSLDNRDLLYILANRDRTYKLFSYLRRQFNGNLFPIESESVVNETHLDVFIRLLKGEELDTGQMNFFEFYDFSVIPIEFVSNIYECFLGNENQRKQGAYYTPPFLVDYILSKTVDSHFQKEEGSISCKVLDPACGSGIFLVETLRRLIHRYQSLNPDCARDKATYQDHLKKLLYDNIFGIDKDRNAIQVAIFSLYITLLDYQEPKDIENFKFPELIGCNFFPSDFFELDTPFNEIFKKNDFNFILGNPPWGNPAAKIKKEDKEKHFKYITYYKTRKIKVGENEISQAFMARCSDFSTEKTQCALIVTSKNLYNIDSRNFRKYFLSHFKIYRVFELSSVRKYLFKKYTPSRKSKRDSGAIGPAAVLFFQWAHGQATDDTIVKHVSLKPNRTFRIFRTFLIEKYDVKEVLQKHFKDYDWLFKVLVYGNILDYYFIKRLKENYPPIMDILNDEDRFAWGRGVSKKGGDENDAVFLVGRYFVDTQGKMLQPFHVDLREDTKWNTPVVHRPRRPELYSPPMLLVKKGTAADFKVTSAVCDQDVAFTDSLTSIKAFNKEDRPILEMLSGLFYSNLFSYYNICIGSSAGIEREQSHDRDEKLSFPYVFNERIVEKVGELERNRKTVKQLDKVFMSPKLQKQKSTLEIRFDLVLKEMNHDIVNAFALSKKEKALVDYSAEISIPLITGKDIKTLSRKTPGALLEEYADIFINHFGKYFNDADSYFSAEIHRTPYIVGIIFNVSEQPPATPIKLIDTSDQGYLFEKILNLGFSNISNDIFIQKDVKGFERDSFYVIKPNQFRLWHQAIAYLDLYEFSDAIMRAGKKQAMEM